MPRLEGKRAIVTGAAGGIGAAIARRFAEEGARVVVCDLDPEGAESTAAELGADRAVAVIGNVADAAFCDQVLATAEDRFGGIDVLVNNAGIARFSPFLEHSLADWNETLAVDLTAVFLLSQRVARAMVGQGTGGAIISTASNNAHVPEPTVAAYNAAKAGVVLLTKSMAIELGAHGIRANCVAPGHVGPTNLASSGGAGSEFLDQLADPIPMGRIGRLEEVASLFAFLASDEAPFINGESIVIDGGHLARQA